MYKILHITNSLGTGGAEMLIADLARLLDKDRFRMNVCCTGSDGRSRAALEEAGSTVTVLNRRRRSSVLFPVFVADILKLFRDITGVIRDERPDLVHTHLEANYIAPFCARYAGVKGIVSSFHSSVLLARRSKWSVRNAARRIVLRRVARTADALLAGSDYAAKAAAELCGVDKRSIEIIRNAVDVSRMDGEAAHPGIREELGLEAGERLLVTLGTVKEPKNHRLLVDAMEVVNRARGGVSAIFIGTGASEFVENLKALAVRRGVRDKVHFLGYREDAYGVVKSCDLMVLPSLWEGLPVAALEGMACGLPVLLSDIPPHRDLLEEVVDGWLFRSNDRDSLAKNILTILEDEDAMRRVAGAGSKKVREHYDSAQMARSCERLYESCIVGAAR